MVCRRVPRLKRNAERLGFYLACMALVASQTLCAATAAAQEPSVSVAASARPRLLLLESPAAPRPGLLTALQIELADLADVEARAGIPGSVGERVQRAGELGREQGYYLVILSDAPSTQADGSQEALLFAVGQRWGAPCCKSYARLSAEAPTSIARWLSRCASCSTSCSAREPRS